MSDVKEETTEQYFKLEEMGPVTLSKKAIQDLEDEWMEKDPTFGERFKFIREQMDAETPMTVVNVRIYDNAEDKEKWKPGILIHVAGTEEPFLIPSA